VDWIYLAQRRGQRRAVVNTVMILPLHKSHVCPLLAEQVLTLPVGLCWALLVCYLE
jgi:hypothetical protein